MALAAALAAVLLASAAAAHAQDAEPRGQAGAFREVAQVVVDQRTGGNSTASVTLQSTDTAHMRAPELAAALGASPPVARVAVTNAPSCALGTGDSACLIVDVVRDDAWETFEHMQEGARGIARGIAGAVIADLGLDASFHSVIAGSDSAGAGLLSAVYVMPREHTASMYAKASERLLPDEIRGAGGFYDASAVIAGAPGASMLFSAVPLDAGGVLYQLRVSVTAEGARTDPVRPLALIGVDRLERSGVFGAGDPLGSLVRVAVSPEGAQNTVTAAAPAIDAVDVGGDLVPVRLDQAGWIISEGAGGTLIDARYIFGAERSVAAGDLELSITGAGAPAEAGPPRLFETPEGIALAAGGVIAAGIAAAYALRARVRARV